jgi:hypothetical protein
MEGQPARTRIPAIGISRSRIRGIVIILIRIFYVIGPKRPRSCRGDFGLGTRHNIGVAVAIRAPMPGFDNLHTAAAQLRLYLQRRLGLTDADLDQGLPLQAWSPELTLDGISTLPPTSSPGSPDGTVTDAEIFQETFRRLDLLRFGTSSFAEDLMASGDAAQEFYGEYARDAGYFPPWLIDDGDTATVGDRDVRASVDRIVDEARDAAIHAGLSPGTLEYNREVLSVLLASLRLPRAEGGFGLRYVFDPGNTHRRRDAVEAVRDGVGDCNAFSFLFYALAHRAGLEPSFIRISGERSTSTGPMRVIHHVGVAVRVEPGGALRPCDPSRGARLDEGLYQWYALTPQEMLANHLRNLALYNERDPVAQERLLLQAYGLAPNTFDIAHDVGWFYEHVLHDSGRAQPYFSRARALNPSLQPIWDDRLTAR